MEAQPFDPDQLRRVLIQHLDGLRRAGVTDLPSPPADVVPLPMAGTRQHLVESEMPKRTVKTPSERPTGAAPSSTHANAEAPPRQRVSGDHAGPVVGGSSSPVSGGSRNRVAGGPPGPGVSGIPAPRAAPISPPPLSPAEPADKPRSPAPPPVRLPLVERESLFAAMRHEVAGCTLCKELARTRTQTVFGAGNLQPRVCFLGEAPGADEDRQGEPFVGRAGQVLTDIIEKGMKLRRCDVYILNVLKCRPPGNRNPNPDEAANCRHFLERQLEILQPEFICCLGTVAAQNLLDSTKPVGQLRGSWYTHGSARVMVTYHPAYLLRQQSAKKGTWEDIQMLMKAMGLAR